MNFDIYIKNIQFNYYIFFKYVAILIFFRKKLTDVHLLVIL